MRAVQELQSVVSQLSAEELARFRYGLTNLMPKFGMNSLKQITIIMY